MFFMGSTEKIDDKDRQIIEILSDNARTSLRDIKKEVELSPSSIRNRMERLVELGVIKRYTVEVDYRKMGYEIQVIVLITTRPGASEQLYEKFNDNKQITEVLRTTGPANFILTVRVKDIDDLTHFITGELEHLDGIERIETMFILPND
ncbi:Lrp/AsnC family transcriptional regulator [Candidatus Thorarchaeota archaeon]|nr:MAG: Lrp/AsnC family transcriptional regulator [Candidatus Thorarchaeota archaeon]